MLPFLVIFRQIFPFFLLESKYYNTFGMIFSLWCLSVGAPPMILFCICKHGRNFTRAASVYDQVEPLPLHQKKGNRSADTANHAHKTQNPLWNTQESRTRKEKNKVVTVDYEESFWKTLFFTENRNTSHFFMNHVSRVKFFSPSKWHQGSIKC